MHFIENISNLIPSEPNFESRPEYSLSHVVSLFVLGWCFLPSIKPDAGGYINMKDVYISTSAQVKGVSLGLCCILIFRSRFWRVGQQDHIDQLLPKCSFSSYECWRWSLFSPLLKGEFSASPLPAYSSSVCILWSCLGRGSLAFLLELLADCHHIAAPSGLLGQGIWLAYHLCVDCCAGWCDNAALWHNHNSPEWDSTSAATGFNQGQSVAAQMFPLLLLHAVHDFQLHWSRSQKHIWVQEEKQSPHRYYITRVNFKNRTHLLIISSCCSVIYRRWNSPLETGLVNKWLQIIQSINSRGTWKYKAVRSEWKLLARSYRGF